MPELTIRTAEPGDMMALMDLAALGAQENGMVPFDIHAISREFWPALHLHRGIVGIIGEKNKPAEGAVLLRVSTFWYGFSEGPLSRPMLEEKWLFVREEFRAVKGGRARKLCEFAKSSAETLGLPLMIGIQSNIRLEAKEKLYRRVFGEPNGVSWIWNPPKAETRAAPSEHVAQVSA